MAAFVCEQCGTSFTAKSSLGRHKEVHERKTLTCDQCQVAFKTKRSLKEHVSAVHSSKPKSYCCDRCSKTFSCKAYLRKHMKTHENEKKFECEYCKNCFGTASHLKRHVMKCMILKQPSVIANEECILCDKRFDKNIKR